MSGASPWREPPGSASGCDPSGGAAWRPWLAGGSPREVLARIVHEDPLGVREHVALALRTGAWLLDADRVLLRTFALVARHAVRYRGRPEVDVWIRALADEAIASLLREDGEAERRALTVQDAAKPPSAVKPPNTVKPTSTAKPTSTGKPPSAEADAAAEPEHGAAFAALARPLGLEPGAMGRACLAFNRLPFPERRAFHALVIAGRTLEDIVRETGESATDVARRARRALEAILGSAMLGSAVPGPPILGSASSGANAAGASDVRSGRRSTGEREVHGKGTTS